jgi:hypothetical protein
MGRSPFCEIRLEARGLSAEPVQLDVTANGVQVTNSGEHGLVQVGASRLAPGDSHMWKREDMLQVGRYVFALNDQLGTAMEELEASELAAPTELLGADIGAE